MRKPALAYLITGLGAQFRRRTPFFFILAFLFLGSCLPQGGSPVDISTPTVDISDSVENLPKPQTGPLDASGDCFRPYADSSIWNIPIDWSSARIHPDSEKMMEAFWEDEKWIGADASQYAPNIYFVDQSTPLVPLQLRKNRFRDAYNDKEIIYGEPASVVLLPIPPNARPADGSDGQLVIINTDTGEEWGIGKGEKDIYGNWRADGAYRYSIYNSGIPPVGFGQRGAGIGQLAGIVRPCEVERGYIGHALTLAYDFPCSPESCAMNGWPGFIPPFTKTDGDGVGRYDIPEGARIIIRPDISISEINDACLGVKGCIVWAQAMQEFGGFIVDNSNHPKTYPEGDDTADWDPAIWSADMLRNVPPEWYDVLDWNVSTP